MHSANSTSRSNMMKFAVAVVATLALLNPLEALQVPRTGSGALADEIQDFVDLMPVDKMMEIVIHYISTDSEVKSVIRYMRSEDSKKMVVEVEAYPEIQNIMNYMQNAGMDIYYVVNLLNKFLGLPELRPSYNARMPRAAAGVRGMLNEVEALIPKQKMQEMYRNKLATSQVWSGFVKQLTSPEFQNVANKMCANDTFNHILHVAKEYQVDVDSVIRIIDGVLGIKIPCRP